LRYIESGRRLPWQQEIGSFTRQNIALYYTREDIGLLWEELLDTPESFLKPSAIEVANAATCLELALNTLSNIEIDGTVGIDRNRIVARGDFSVSFI
jgi:hypothetical protein